MEPLPAQIVEVLPVDPASQLEVAHLIANYAYGNKVSSLEAELLDLQDNVAAKAAALKVADRRIESLEGANAELQEQVAQQREDASQALLEKNSLIDTVKRLNRDMLRLENFKRNLLAQLNDSNSSVGCEEVSDPAADLAGDRLVSSVLSAAHREYSAPPPLGEDVGQQTPSSGRRGLASGYSRSGATADLRPLSPSVQSRANAGERNVKVDGKAFFRQARQQLSYEQFSRFLLHVRQLNAGQQTREATLRSAKDIFGASNADLYVLFEGLLSRHVTQM